MSCLLAPGRPLTIFQMHVSPHLPVRTTQVISFHLTSLLFYLEAILILQSSVIIQFTEVLRTFLFHIVSQSSLYGLHCPGWTKWVGGSNHSGFFVNRRVVYNSSPNSRAFYFTKISRCPVIWGHAEISLLRWNICCYSCLCPPPRKTRKA